MPSLHSLHGFSAVALGLLTFGGVTMLQIRRRDRKRFKHLVSRVPAKEWQRSTVFALTSGVLLYLFLRQPRSWVKLYGM